MLYEEGPVIGSLCCESEGEEIVEGEAIENREEPEEKIDVLPENAVESEDLENYELANSNRAERKKIDKLAAIRGVFEHFVDNCKAYYTPSEYLTIDEKLEPFRCRVSFLQYIPNKPAKYGLKVFALVDAKTCYSLNMEVYVGTQQQGPFRKSNSPQDIVERLILPVSGTKRNITFDNYINYNLMINLLNVHFLVLIITFSQF
ncbi:hypothetical protein NQ317_002961 [Molorchus minor]|uniref:PiggyBac transposable element-derived protein domain-containing protein n=1 Tax=Molorchus minor TaxID=1323400 RepID=A0ABQ9J292_9CUCU|nr:hypothetical protein NQ317_002961 [Molorchus minor]